MINEGDINLPHVLMSIEAEFQRYERALMQNDISVLDELFWHSSDATRFGSDETLYGIDAIRNFRKQRDVRGITRRLFMTNITTFGEDYAVTTTQFEQSDKPVGRQTQVWVRFDIGWRIVSAHISALP